MDTFDAVTDRIGLAQIGALVAVFAVAFAAVAWTMSAPASAAVQVDDFSVDGGEITIEEGTDLDAMHLAVDGTVSYQHLDRDSDMTVTLFVEGPNGEYERVDATTTTVSEGDGQQSIALEGDVLEQTGWSGDDFAPEGDQQSYELTTVLHVEVAEDPEDPHVTEAEDTFTVTVEHASSEPLSVTINAGGHVTLDGEEVEE